MARTILVQKNRRDFVVKLDQVRKWKDEESTVASDPAPNVAAVSKSAPFYDPLSSPINERSDSPTSCPFPVTDDINAKLFLWRGTPWSLEVDAVVNSTNEVSLERKHPWVWHQSIRKRTISFLSASCKTEHLPRIHQTAMANHSVCPLACLPVTPLLFFTRQSHATYTKKKPLLLLAGLYRVSMKPSPALASMLLLARD